MNDKERASKWKRGHERAEKQGAGITRVKFPAPPAGKTSTTILMLAEDDYEECYVVFVDDTQGGRRRIVLSIDDWESGNQNHPLIEEYKSTGDESLRATLKYFLNVVEGEVKKFQKKKAGKYVLDDEDKPVIIRQVRFDPQVKLLEVGSRIFKQLSAYRDDPDYPNGIMKLIFKVERTGSGKNDTSYVVKANQVNVPPLPDDMSELYNLTDLAAATSHEEVCKIMGLKPQHSSVSETKVEEESNSESDESDELDDVVGEESGEEEVPEADGDDLEELEEL